MFFVHFFFLCTRFSHSIPPSRHFHRVSPLSPRRRCQRGRRSPRLLPLFRGFSQGRPRRHPRRLHRFLRSFFFPFLVPIPSVSHPPLPFPCLIDASISFLIRNLHYSHPPSLPQTPMSKLDP